MKYLSIVIIVLIISLISCEPPIWKKQGFETEEAFSQHVKDSIAYANLTPMEKSLLSNSLFSEFVDFIDQNTEFLGFSGRWDECNHEYHDYFEFNFFGDKRVKLSFTKTDSAILYDLDYLNRDIREVWGTETIVKHISSIGEIDFVQQKDGRFKYVLSDSNLNDLIYLTFTTNDYNKPRIEVWFDCKTCSGDRRLYLYQAEEIKERLVGYRLHLWEGYY